ncbi:MAG: hypothetical protein MJ114_00745 [Acetatifactor sp.]|nr:hypothetical protein [Acetatifactor sp.]
MEFESVLAEVFSLKGNEWVWFASNQMTSRMTGKKLKNSAFDIRGQRVKLFDYPVGQKFIGVFCYEGLGYEFNFSKVLTCPRTKIECFETEKDVIWSIKQGTRREVMITEIHCSKDSLISTGYEVAEGKGPKAKMLSCDNGTARIKLYQREGQYVTLIDDVDVENVKCEFGVVGNDSDI